MTNSFYVKIRNFVTDLKKSFEKWLQRDYIKVCPKCSEKMLISYPTTTCTNKRCSNRITIEKEPHIFDLQATRFKVAAF